MSRKDVLAGSPGLFKAFLKSKSKTRQPADGFREKTLGIKRKSESLGEILMSCLLWQELILNRQGEVTANSPSKRGVTRAVTLGQ